MGDNKFRFNATDFLPSFRQINGVRLDKFAPRVTFSGPLARNRAWFFDGAEGEYDNIYIQELPLGADTNRLTRGSNLFKAQVNLTSANILSGGLLFNDYHSPYDGISSLVPQESTRNATPSHGFPISAISTPSPTAPCFDTGFGVVRIRDGYEPHGDTPYELTPETALGSYFENEVGHSQREELTATLYLPPRHWAGRHDLKAGIEFDHISFDENVSRAPVNYLREDGTLLRQSVFPAQAPFSLHNLEIGAYVQDRWLIAPGLLIESGLRFDWDEIIRRPLFAPRIAAVYSPPGARIKHKNLRGHRSLLRAHPARIPHTRSRRHTLRHLLRPRWNHPHRRAPRNHLPGERRLPHRVARPQLEPRRRAKTSRTNLCRRKLSPKARLRRLRLRKPGPTGLSVRNLPAHQHPAGLLQILRDRSAPHLHQRLHALRLLHPILSDNQRRNRLHANSLHARAAAERTAPLGYSQPPHLLGMASHSPAASSKRTGTSSTPSTGSQDSPLPRSMRTTRSSARPVP